MADQVPTLRLEMERTGSRAIIQFTTVKQEVKRQLWLAGPMILVNLFQFGVQLVSVMFVGHLSELDLSSASIASSIATVTGSSVLIGMGCALDTLCGQAYGAQEFNLLGLYMQRALLVLNGCGILLAFAWANMEKILLALGQDAAISKKAGEFTLWLIPSLFAYATGQPLVKFLQTQSIVIPLLVFAGITFCCHIPFCWFAIYKSGLGSRGAALATSMTTWINVLLMAIYVRLSPTCAKTRTPLTIRAFHNLIDFIKLAVPSALMVCLEWWSYEALVIMSGLLPNPQLETSVISICYNVAAFAFMIPSGLGAMASTRVANELGAGRPAAARLAVYVSVGIASIEAVIACTCFICLRNLIGRAYSNEEEVITYIAKMAPILAATTVLDSFQGLLTGISRGCGWQRAGAYINLVSYYGVGLPAAVVLAFVFHVNAGGLWMGIGTGAVVQLIALIAITWVTSWQKEAIKAAKRINSCSESVLEPLMSESVLEPLVSESVLKPLVLK